MRIKLAMEGVRLLQTIRFPDGRWLHAGDIRELTSVTGRVRAAAGAAGAAGEVQFMLAMDDGRLLHTIRFPNGTWQIRVGDADAASGLSGSVLAVAAASACCSGTGG